MLHFHSDGTELLPGFVVQLLPNFKVTHLFLLSQLLQSGRVVTEYSFGWYVLTRHMYTHIGSAERFRM
jgi:type IV secretory pathway component VirB8